MHARENNNRRWGWASSLLVVGAMALAQAACANAGTAGGHGAAGPSNTFAGSWSVKVCDKAMPAGECGGFTVDLLQKGSRICGAHHAATPRLSRIDEGQGRSVVGTVVGNTAVLTIRSGRNGAIAMATLEKQADGVHWVRTEKVLDGEGGDDLIAVDTVLERSKPEDLNPASHDALASLCKAYWGEAR
ncbi:hypothetical protein [Hydrogenophaga sp. 5NK40-0174]|uniref:hypothetical protein n=1 Tax=Hydrogenophaga sp. 5NK40-0174 TaxID=3127649 RepID=UPI0031045C25